jgi:L-threonylcarbamoyladenylate synthase
MNFKSRQAIRFLKAGGLVSIPTDTIQGLSCLPEFDYALERLIVLKNRSLKKGLLLLASERHYFEPFVANVQDLQAIDYQTPPTTYLLKAHLNTNIVLTGGQKTIALRLSKHPLIVDLCRACASALVSSSANISHRPVAKNIRTLKQIFPTELDYIIPPEDGKKLPSKIINFNTGERLR